MMCISTNSDAVMPTRNLLVLTLNNSMLSRSYHSVVDGEIQNVLRSSFVSSVNAPHMQFCVAHYVKVRLSKFNESPGFLLFIFCRHE